MPGLRAGRITQHARFRLTVALASVTALTGALLFAWSASEGQRFRILHQGVTEEYRRLSQAIMLGDATPLETLSKDYTQWDDMVRFVTTKDPAWAEQNLVPALPTYGADASQVYDVKGRLIYANHVEGQGWIDRIAPPSGLIEAMRKGRPQRHFFQFVDGKLVEVRTSTIQPSDDDARATPAQGFYFAFRAWDAKRLSRLQSVSGMKASLIRYPYLSAPLSDAQGRAGRVEVLHPFQDVRGKPIGAIRLQEVSPVVARAASSSTETVRLVAAAILALVATTLVAVAVWCFRPLARLASFLDDRDARHLKIIRNAGAEYGRLAEQVQSSFAQQDELVQARDRAQEASRQKSEFLANMSHEIRTPLNGVLGMLSFLEESSLSPEQRSWVFTARASADTLLGVIHDILDLSKIEAGQLQIESQPFDLAALMSLICAGPAALCGQKGIAFHVELDPTVQRGFCGDGLRIQQVMGNLLSNAMKFTQTGSITVSVVREEDSVRFAVRDTGIGIPAERLDAIFESFVQADGSTTRHYGGTGLGLTIVRRLCDLMGGQVRVTSTVGRGSEFIFCLPLKEAEVLTPEPAPVLVEVTGLRVLLAEDNDVNRRVAVKALEKFDCQVHCVPDGLAAVAAWQEEPFDLVLMDVQMPKMDGLEATRQIRKMEAGGCRTWIVALTANVLPDDIAQCAEAGMDGHLGKPLRREELRALLASAPMGAGTAG
jgi:signal transduction histidine kinase/CheY-like chemotaxis protein